MSNQIVISSGAKVRELEGVLTGTSGIVSSVPLGTANGVATLDSGGKVPVSQLPSSVVTYLGTWNAATNTPTLTNGTGDAGDMYICNVAGTVNFGAGPITFAVGDWVLYGSGTWQKSSGQNGTVTSVAASITGNAIGITGSPITTAGTLALAFAGTSAQYINGAGNLVTFPTITTEAQRLITEVYNETGATLTKGTVVYINGGHGNLPTVTKAIATSDATSAQTYGVVQTDITNMNNGYVVVIGSLTNLDTQAYPNGTQLYLSSTTAGAWTSTKQYAPAHLVYVGIVTRSHPTQGVVEIRIQNGFELDELHNVSAQTPSNNDGIFYNSTTSLWESKSIAAALGYTPANDSLVVHLAGTETITGIKTFSNGLNSDYVGVTGDITMDGSFLLKQVAYGTLQSGYTNLSGQTNGLRVGLFGGYNALLNFSASGSYTYTFPNATGTIALTSDISYPVTSVFGRTGAVVAAEGDYSLTQLSDVTITSPTNGQVLKYNGTAWVNNSDTDTGITSLNGLTALTQTFAVGTSGTDFNISSATSTHTFNLPTASATNRGALSSADWSTFNGKQPQLNGTGFVKATGTTISYDNSTYLTTSAASSTYVPYTGATGAVNLGAYDLTVNGIKVGAGGGSGANNVRVGSEALFSITSASNNVAIGTNSLYSVTSGNANMALGGNALYGVTTGLINIGIGFTAGSSITTGSYNTIIGKYAGTATLNSTVVLADGAGNLKFVAFDTGNVYLGAGTSLPTDSGYKLDVNGTARFSGALTGTSATLSSTLRVNGGTATIYSATEARLNLNTEPDGEQTTGWFYSDNNVTLGSTYNVYLQALGTTVLSVLDYRNFASGTANSYGGNVFIGTKVAQAINVGAGLSLGGWTTSTGSSVSFARLVGRKENGTSGNEAGYLAFETSSASPNQTFERARITSAGNLLIGSTTDAGYKLDVNGTGRFSNIVYALSYQALNSNTSGYSVTTYANTGASGKSYDIGVGGNTSAQANRFYIYDNTANALRFYIDTTGAATFSSSVTAGGSLTVNAGSNDGIFSNVTGAVVGFKITQSSATNDALFRMQTNGHFYDLRANSSNALSIDYDGGSRMYINSSGNVGIGTSSPISYGNFTSLTIASSTTTNQSAIFLINSTTSIRGSWYQNAGAQINFGTATSHPLVFDTNDTERMRITSGGQVLIGKTSSTVGDIGIWMRGVNGDIYSTIANAINTYHVFDGTNGVYRFYVSGAGTISATNTTISSLSDIRLKENIIDLDMGLNVVMALKPRKYDWKKESGNVGKNVRGFIAQEVEEILPDLIDISQMKEIPKDGIPYKALRQDFIPILVKAIQEQQTQIEELKQLIK